MSIVLVGRFKEHRYVRWTAALILASLLGVVCAAVAGATYFALSREFSFVATAIGFMAPFIAIGAGIQRALRLPMEQLTPIE